MLIVLLTFKVASRGLYLLPRTQCLSCSALDAGEPLDAVGGGGGWWTKFPGVLGAGPLGQGNSS